MKNCNNKTEQKKEWATPDLVVYGNIATLTQDIKPKQPGSTDDFGVAGVSDP